MNGTKSTVQISGKRFKRVSCSTTKGGAQKQAATIRKKGGTARVLKTSKTGSEYCVYQGPQAKAPFGGKRKKKATKAKTTRTRRAA